MKHLWQKIELVFLEFVPVLVASLMFDVPNNHVHEMAHL